MKNNNIFFYFIKINSRHKHAKWPASDLTPWTLTLKGETPLHFATKTENFEVLKILLEFSKNKNPANNAGVTLLHLGAKQGNLAIFEYVWNLTLEKNPGNDSGFTPLHVACERGHLDIVKFLVSRLKG